jgi:type II secretory pathway component PulF
MPEGLRALGEELSPGPLRRMLVTLSGMLESGVPLEAAIESQGGRFPEHLRSLVRVGARSGALGQVLGRYIDYHDVGAELRRKTWLSLAYPILAIVASLVLFVLVSFLLVNGIAPLFRDFGVDVPLVTRFVLGASHLVVGGWWSPLWIVGVLVAAWVVLFVALPTARRRSLAGLIPVLGKVWRWTSLAEFCHIMGVLLESGIPLGQAVRISGEGVQNASLMTASRRVAQDVEAGDTLSGAIARQSIFPAGLSRLLAWPEGQSALAGTLHTAGDIYEARARAQASFASAVYGVASVIVVLLGIGLVVGAIMLPLISMISRLSG